METLGYKFGGHGDIDVIIEARAEWGIATTVNRLIDIFNFDYPGAINMSLEDPRYRLTDASESRVNDK